MARAIWSGSISFGLVNVPVGLYSATSEHEVSFHQFQKGTAARIRYKRVNEDTGDEVDYEDIVKGVELDDGRYVIITPEELESVEPTKSRTIDISDFVEAADIDPIYYHKTYFLAPTSDSAKKAYALLAAAMEKAERIGVATFVMRDKQYLAAIRPKDGILVLETMFFADEVRNAKKELDNLPGKYASRGKDLGMAVALIESLTTRWDPKNYRDSYTERVEKLIKAKKADREIVTEHEDAADPGKVVDLLSALQASIENAQSHKPGNTTRITKLRTQKKSAAKAVAEGADNMSKTDLAAAAKELDVQGRSQMSEKQLRASVKKAAENTATKKTTTKTATTKTATTKTPTTKTPAAKTAKNAARRSTRKAS